MTVIQRTPNLGLTLRMQRIAAPAVAPAAGDGGLPGDPQPPVWARWFDDADEPATEIQLETYMGSGGVPLGRFVVGPVVAHVAGGVDVEWEVTFVPTLWAEGTGDVLWTGDVLASTLPLAVAPGDNPTPPTRAIVLPDLGGESPSFYWPHSWRDAPIGTVYEPLMVAVGNTLTVALETGSSPGVLEAVAKVGTTVLGTVRLTAYLEITVP